MAVTQQDLRVAVRYPTRSQLQEALANAETHNQDNALHMVQAALGLMYGDPTRYDTDSQHNSTHEDDSPPSTFIQTDEEKGETSTRSLTVTIYKHIWQYLCRANELSRKPAPLMDFLGTGHEIIGVVKRELGLFLHRILNDVMHPNTYCPDFLADIKAVFDIKILTEGYADFLIGEAIDSDELLARFFSCRDLLMHIFNPALLNAEDNTPKRKFFAQWLSTRASVSQQLAEFENTLLQNLTQHGQNLLWAAFNELFHGYSTVKMNTFFCTPGTSKIQTCLCEHIQMLCVLSDEFARAWLDKTRGLIRSPAKQSRPLFQFGFMTPERHPSGGGSRRQRNEGNDVEDCENQNTQQLKRRARDEPANPDEFYTLSPPGN